MKASPHSLPSEFFTFVRDHADADTAALALKPGALPEGFPLSFALTQIEARRKARRKLPLALACGEFLFPSALLAEQASDERLAEWHADVAQALPGMRVADLTFGLGVDAFAFARRGAVVSGVEIDAGAARIGAHNAAALSLSGVGVENADAVEWLAEAAAAGRHYDLLFADPARRGAGGRRLYNLNATSPSLTELMENGRRVAPRMLVKASPMLSPQDVMDSIPEVGAVYAVGLRGECKELLLDIRFDITNPDAVRRTVAAVDLDDPLRRRWVRSLDWRTGLKFPLPVCQEYSPGAYLCEPGPALLRAEPIGAALMREYPDIRFTGTAYKYFDSRPVAFPGRVFRIEAVFNSLREAAGALRGESANVAVRSYPLAAESLRVKVGLKPAPDADRFLIGTLDGGGRRSLLWCAGEQD